MCLKTLKVDDFVAVKPEEHYPDRKPLLARVTTIDEEEETFEAVWWKPVSNLWNRFFGQFLDLKFSEPVIL